MSGLEFIESNFEDPLFTELFKDQIKEDLNLPLSKEQTKTLVANQLQVFIAGTENNYPSARPFFIKNKGEVSGIAIIDRSTKHIVYLMVIPEKRRSGIAGKAVCKLLKDDKYTLSVMKQNTGAIRFYESMNFKISKDENTHWLMTSC